MKVCITIVFGPRFLGTKAKCYRLLLKHNYIDFLYVVTGKPQDG